MAIKKSMDMNVTEDRYLEDDLLYPAEASTIFIAVSPKAAIMTNLEMNGVDIALMEDILPHQF